MLVLEVYSSSSTFFNSNVDNILKDLDDENE